MNHKIVMSQTPAVSVIVPVYGVEAFIGRAVESMMAQTLQSVEFIFVDDCTSDGSMEVVRRTVERFPGRKVIYLRHDTNRGLPAARNTGLAAASGRYIFHWDSDDYAEPAMLQAMLEAAETSGADYVWADWYLTFGTNSRRMPQPDAHTPRQALTSILSGTMKYNVWNKLVARELYTSTSIRFPEGLSMGEDMTMIKLLAHARAVCHVAEPFYHYIRTNTSALTQNYTEAHLAQLLQNTADTCSHLAANIKDREIDGEIKAFKLNVKLPFLFTNTRAGFELWNKWFPEANSAIMANKAQSMRTRMLQLAAKHRLTFINRLYNTLVLKVVYGLIYR